MNGNIYILILSVFVVGMVSIMTGVAIGGTSETIDTSDFLRADGTTPLTNDWIVGNNNRIMLSSDEPILGDSNVLDMQWTDQCGKPAMVWSDENADRQAAIVAHHLANNCEDIHQHFSIETSKETVGGLWTRFAIGWGEDIAHIHFTESEVHFGGLGAGVPIETYGSILQRAAGGITTGPADGSGPGTLDIFRGESSDDARLRFRESGAENDGTGPLRWSLGLRGNDNNLHFRDVGSGNTRMILQTDGILTLGNENPVISGSGASLNVSGDTIRIEESRTIENSNDECFEGEISWDDDYVYVCVEDDTWKRSGLEGW